MSHYKMTPYGLDYTEYWAVSKSNTQNVNKKCVSTALLEENKQFEVENIDGHIAILRERCCMNTNTHYENPKTKTHCKIFDVPEAGPRSNPTVNTMLS